MKTNLNRHRQVIKLHHLHLSSLITYSGVNEEKKFTIMSFPDAF